MEETFNKFMEKSLSEVGSRRIRAEREQKSSYALRCKLTC